MPETAAGQPMQRGPNTHHMDAPSDVTTWTVIQTTRNVVTDDGREMTLRDEWWEVPSFVVEQIDREARALGRAEALAAVRAAVTLDLIGGIPMPWYDEANPDYSEARDYLLAAIDDLETGCT